MVDLKNILALMKIYRRFIEVYQTMFWGEWKVNVDVLYEDISDNVRFSEGAIEICTKVSWFYAKPVVPFAVYFILCILTKESVFYVNFS